MAAIYEYVRNIAVYIIFMCFAGILVPEGKVKGYVNLTMSVILVLILVTPVMKLFGTDSERLLYDIGLGFDKTVMAGEYAYNNEAQNKLIISAFKTSLEEQVKQLVTPYTGYGFADVDFRIGETERDFGQILNIYLTVKEQPEPGTGGMLGGLIRIEPVSVRVGTGEPLPQSNESENEEVFKIKNALSDFYNIPSSNIYITVQMMEQGR